MSLGHPHIPRQWRGQPRDIVSFQVDTPCFFILRSARHILLATDTFVPLTIERVFMKVETGSCMRNKVKGAAVARR